MAPQQITRNTPSNYANGLGARNSFRVERLDPFADDMIIRDVLEINVKWRESTIGDTLTHKVQQSKPETKQRLLSCVCPTAWMLQTYLCGVQSSPH